MSTYPHPTDNHDSHDDQWCVLSIQSQHTLCIACVIENLEDKSLTNVQKQFNISLLTSILTECNEVPQLLHDHLQVCQHILDIITDYYTDNLFLSSSVYICVQLMDILQSEELYVYLLNKFHCQVQTGTGSSPFVITSLGKLSMISSAYVLTLILAHENLLLLLLESHVRGHLPADDVSECSLVFLLVHLFDVEVLPVVPPQVLPLVEKCLVNWITSAQLLDVQINALALLKRMLNADCYLWDNSDSWAAMLLGFKRMFVSKKEVLVTAATQCLIIAARIPRVLYLILESDLPEFLFESLHTMNNVQLETVFACLYSFSGHDLFFKKCHAVYGLESVLRSLDIALESQNVSVLEKGLGLMSNVLQRQNNSIPVFVNKSSMDLTMSVITKALHCHILQVALPSITTATAFLRDANVARQQPVESIQTIVEVTLQIVESVVWRKEAASVLSSIQISAHQFLDAVLKLLTVVFIVQGDCAKRRSRQLPFHRSKKGEGKVFSRAVLDGCKNFIYYFSDHFTECGKGTLQDLCYFLNALYEFYGANMQEMSSISVSSGLVLNFLVKKLEFRSNSELLTTANNWIEQVFQLLLMENVPQFQALPDCIRSGLRQLVFESTLQQTVDNITEKDTAEALCMVFYFCSLSNSNLFSAAQILHSLEELVRKQILTFSYKKPLTCRFILYLLAWGSALLCEDAGCSASVSSVENAVMQSVKELPVDLWATPDLQVFVWLFETHQRAWGPGASLLEFWLLHTKGNFPAEDDSLQAQVLCDLFFNRHFRAVLLNQLTSNSEEISVLAKKLVVTLIAMEKKEDGQQNSKLIGSVHNEVMSLFHDLFLSSLQPSCHIVNNILQVITALMQYPEYELAETDQERQIRIIFFVISFIGAVDKKDYKLQYSGMSYLHSLSIVTSEELDKTVVPVLLQNASFLQNLERCIHDKETALSSTALSIAAWISYSHCDCLISKPVSVSVKLILQSIQNHAYQHIQAALKILYLSLEPRSVTMPLSFYRPSDCLQSGPLFTAQELRQLFSHVQQYICSEDKNTQFCAVQCLQKLIQHSTELDSILGQQLIHHPWNSQLIHFVLSQHAPSMLEIHILELIKQIWWPEDNVTNAEIAKHLLESVLATSISHENLDLIVEAIQKAKVLCKDDRLMQEAMSRLAPFQDSLSVSQK